MFDTIRFYEPYDIFRTFYFIFQFLIQIWKHVKFSTNSVFLRPVPARTGPVYRWEPFELRVLVWILNSIGFFWFLVEPVRFTGTSRLRFGTSGREKKPCSRVWRACQRMSEIDWGSLPWRCPQTCYAHWMGNLIQWVVCWSNHSASDENGSDTNEYYGYSYILELNSRIEFGNRQYILCRRVIFIIFG
jgi:hypothetical protein